MMGVMAVKVVPYDGFLVNSAEADGSFSDTTILSESRRDILMTSFADERRDIAGDNICPVSGVAAPT